MNPPIAHNSPPDDASLAFRQRLSSLLADGKAKQAVELAKGEHKRLNTPETEQALVDAYVARIKQFQEKHQASEAQVLIDLVRSRFPAHVGQLEVVQLKAAALGGQLAQLVAPLAQPELSDNLRQTIETALRQQVIDLPALACVTSLPADHPLRGDAEAVWSGFKAVTSGAVVQEQVALPQVSRKSPLASWKMLIRALAAFYQREDELCRRSIDAIAPDAAAAKLGLILRDILDGKRGTSAVVAKLQDKVGLPGKGLKEALGLLEQAISKANHRATIRWSQEALSLCQSQHPQMLEKLRQHLFAKLLGGGAPMNVFRGIIGNPRADSAFWKLLAVSAAMGNELVTAAICWDRFRIHCIAEKTIARGSLEEATICLEAAGCLWRLKPSELEVGRRQLMMDNFVTACYQRQSPEIAALKPQSDASLIPNLTLDYYFGAATAIAPDSSAYGKWLMYYAQHSPNQTQHQEMVAQRWHQAIPRDVKPLLVLSKLAEQRNALKLATGHLDAAEAIDPMHPEVRQARLRLLLATTWRHLKNKKPHLVSQDLIQLQAMPAMAERHRAGLMAAIRSALYVLLKDTHAAAEVFRKLIDQVGVAMAEALCRSVAIPASLVEEFDFLRPDLPPAAPLEVAQAEASLLQLSADLGVKMYRPVAWSPMIDQVLRQSPCPLPVSSILAITRSAASEGDLGLAYQATVAGLALSHGEMAARFLLSRSRCIPRMAVERRQQCIKAAAELARQGHDPGLNNEIAYTLDGLEDDAMDLSWPIGNRPLDPQRLEAVLKLERQASIFPQTVASANNYLAEPDPVDSRTWDPANVDAANEDDFPADLMDDNDEMGGFDMSAVPPDVRNLLDQFLPDVRAIGERTGRAPTPEDLAKLNPELLIQLLQRIAGGDVPRNEIEDQVRQMGDSKRHPDRKKRRRR